MIDKTKAQIFPQPYPSASCDAYMCKQRSRWFVGRPDAPLAICLKLCDDCLRNVVESLPEGFKPQFTPPKGMVMVDEATYKEMEEATAAVRALQVAAEQARETISENATVEAKAATPKVGAKKV